MWWDEKVLGFKGKALQREGTTRPGKKKRGRVIRSINLQEQRVVRISDWVHFFFEGGWVCVCVCVCRAKGEGVGGDGEIGKTLRSFQEAYPGEGYLERNCAMAMCSVSKERIYFFPVRGGGGGGGEGACDTSKRTAEKEKEKTATREREREREREKESGVDEEDGCGLSRAANPGYTVQSDATTTCAETMGKGD